jgi:hypothetical protein
VERLCFYTAVGDDQIDIALFRICVDCGLLVIHPSNLGIMTSQFIIDRVIMDAIMHVLICQENLTISADIDCFVCQYTYVKLFPRSINLPFASMSGLSQPSIGRSFLRKCFCRMILWSPLPSVKTSQPRDSPKPIWSTHFDDGFR